MATAVLTEASCCLRAIPSFSTKLNERPNHVSSSASLIIRQEARAQLGAKGRYRRRDWPLECCSRGSLSGATGNGERNVISSEVRCGAQQVAVQDADYSQFLRDVAAVEPPRLLPTLLKVLEARGEELVSPAKRSGIIPLAVPLSRDPVSGELTALLRWPTAPDGMDMPVVRVQKNGVLLLAKTIETFIARNLAEEDAAGGPGRISSAAGEAGALLYKPGSFTASKIATLPVYLMKKVGLFPDVLETLALNHLQRGDEVSALVTGEFYSGRGHFPGFGRPYTFNAELLLTVKRRVEAKDAARIAMKSPWWTLGATYQEMSELAGWGDAQLEYALERVSEQGRVEDITKGKAPEQVALDQAAFLLDLASVDCSWDEKREQLAALYRTGGLGDMANFVLSVS